MKKFGYSFPILEHKIEQWKQFAQEIKTTRLKEFGEMHKRIGVKKESWYLLKSSDSYSVVVYTEADNENFMQNFKNDNSDFSEWFRDRVSEFQDVDLNQNLEMPIMILDWEEKNYVQ